MADRVWAVITTRSQNMQATLAIFLEVLLKGVIKMFHPNTLLTHPQQLIWQTPIELYMPDPPEDGTLLNSDICLRTVNGHDEQLMKTVTETLIVEKSSDKEKVIRIDFKPVNLDNPEHEMQHKSKIIVRYKEHGKWKTDLPLHESCRSIKELIEKEMTKRGDKWDDIFAMKHYMKYDCWRFDALHWYDYRINNGKYPYFVVLTKKWIYFPVEYDSSIWVQSLPRHLPNVDYTPKIIGG